MKLIANHYSEASLTHMNIGLMRWYKEWSSDIRILHTMVQSHPRDYRLPEISVQMSLPLFFLRVASCVVVPEAST
jgi:hypothetical protein